MTGEARRLGHYHCELARTRHEAGDTADAQRALELALKADAGCVRASLMQARIACDGQHYRRAIAAIRRLAKQDLRLLSEALDMMILAHEQLGREHDLLRLLQDSVAAAGPPAVTVALAERLARRDGAPAALEMLSAQLVRQPALCVLHAMLVLQARVGSELEFGAASSAFLQPMIDAVDTLLHDSSTHRCEVCSLAGRTLHWQCPGCKTWGSTIPQPPRLLG